MADPTVKDRALKAIEGLPRDATLEDAMERLYLLHKVEQGLEDAEAGRTLSHEEVKKQVRSWRR